MMRGWRGVEVPLRPWSGDDVVAAVASAPSPLCAPAARLDRLRALAPCDSFAALLGRLSSTQLGDLGAAGRLAERLAEPRRWCVAGGEIAGEHVGVVGDLEVDGDLSVVAALVVTGDLIVRGTLSDCGPESRIVVLGALRCQHVDTSGWVMVCGDVEVEGIVAGRHNDESFECHAVVRAGAIVSDEHAFEAAGGLAPRRTPARPGAWGAAIFDLREEAHVDELRALLGEALDAQGELAWDHMPPRVD